MKDTSLLMVVALIAVMTISAIADADSSLGGFMFAHVFQEEGSDAEVTSATLRLIGEDRILVGLSRTPVRFGLVTEFDTRQAGSELRRAYGFISSEEMTVSAGWIFLAAGYAGPAPQFSRMVRYPRCPFTYAVRAYGVQLSQSYGDKISWTADLTGKSGVAYNDDDVFDRLEGSLFASAKVPYGIVEVATQLSEDFNRFSIGGHAFLAPKLGAYGVVYYSDEDTRAREVSAFGQLAYRLNTWVEPHVQAEARQDGDTVYTAGLMAGSYAKLAAFAGYEFGDQEGAAFRIQVRHDF